MTPNHLNGESICANIGEECFGRGKDKTVRKKMNDYR